MPQASTPGPPVATAFFRIAVRGRFPFHSGRVKIVILDAYTANPGDLDWAPLEALGQVQTHDRTPSGLIAERAADAEIVLTNKTVLDTESIGRLAKLPCREGTHRIHRSGIRLQNHRDLASQSFVAQPGMDHPGASQLLAES